MLEKLVYKVFSSTPRRDVEDGSVYGIVDDVEGFAEYESDTPEGAERAFHDAVDDYIDGCREAGVPARSDATAPRRTPGASSPLRTRPGTC